MVSECRELELRRGESRAIWGYIGPYIPSLVLKQGWLPGGVWLVVSRSDRQGRGLWETVGGVSARGQRFRDKFCGNYQLMEVS
jgi:hypothetical protein